VIRLGRNTQRPQRGAHTRFAPAAGPQLAQTGQMAAFADLIFLVMQKKAG